MESQPEVRNGIQEVIMTNRGKIILKSKGIVKYNENIRVYMDKMKCLYVIPFRKKLLDE